MNRIFTLQHAKGARYIKQARIRYLHTMLLLWYMCAKTIKIAHEI